jgi:hypothetical protein
MPTKKDDHYEDITIINQAGSFDDLHANTKGFMIPDIQSAGRLFRDQQGEQEANPVISFHMPKSRTEKQSTPTPNPLQNSPITENVSVNLYMDYPTRVNTSTRMSISDLDVDRAVELIAAYYQKSTRKKPSNSITQIFIKKKPTWNLLFNKIHDCDSDLYQKKEWNESIELIYKNSYILKGRINPQDYIQEIDKNFFIGLSFLTKIKNDLTKCIIEFKRDKFIKQHFSKKHLHLINRDNRSVLYDLFANNVSTKDIKTNITSRIHTIKDKYDLTSRLENLMAISLNWTHEHYLKLATDNNIKIMENTTSSLTLCIDNYNNLLLFAPTSWCIATSSTSFSRYVHGTRQHFIELNFDKYPNSKNSIRGITINSAGKILHAHDALNTNIIKKTSLKKYTKMIMSDDTYLNIISKDCINIDQIAIKVLDEKEHLFYEFLSIIEHQFSNYEIKYINESHVNLKKLNNDKCVNFYNYIETIKDAIGRRTYNPFRDQFKLLPFLLSTNNLPYIFHYLNLVQKYQKIDITRLAFSTNHNLVDKNTQKHIFQWINKHK